MYYNPSQKKFMSLGKMSSLYGIIPTEDNANKLGFYEYITEEIDERFFDRQTIILSENKCHGVYKPNEYLISLLRILANIETHIAIPLHRVDDQVLIMQEELETAQARVTALEGSIETPTESENTPDPTPTPTGY